MKIRTTLITLLSTALTATASGWSLTAKEKVPALYGFLEGADLSGMAMAGAHVVVASDELMHAQVGRLNKEAGMIQFESAIPLSLRGAPEPAGKGGKKKKKEAAGELDLEGVAWSAEEKVFYVTGSHGVGKKKGDVQPQRFGVFRIPFDAETGKAAGAVSSASLLPWLQTSERFKAHLFQPLQQNGFNIEGLAFADGQLYFGVRGPNVEGKAFIVSVEAEALFADEGRGVEPAVHEVPLGEGTGIREITAVRGGFLILSGNASAEGTKLFPESTARKEDAAFTLSFLPAADGKAGAPVRIGDVSAPGGKAEGLLVMNETDSGMDVLVLHDGIEQGGVTAFTVKRPAATGSGVFFNPEPAPAKKTRLVKLEDCPGALRAAVQKNGHDKQLVEIKEIEEGGKKTWQLETGSEENGADAETNYFYDAAGTLLKTERDIPFKDAPAAVQAALTKLAGADAVVDDVEEVTEGDKVHYKAELESNGGADRKVRLSAAGEVLKLEEEKDD